MTITNELLAAYAEGKVSQEEREAVRNYLVEHPETLRTVMIMMDEYYDIELDDATEEEPQNNALPLFDENKSFGLPMAAFAPNPMEKKRLKTISDDLKKEDNDDFLKRLNELNGKIRNH